MSAHVIDETHYATLASTLQTAMYGSGSCGPEIHRGIAGEIIAGDYSVFSEVPYKRGEELITEFVNKLMAQNVASVNYRYPNEAPEPFFPLPPKSKWAGRWTAIETLKFLQCVDYQCCETPNYEESEVGRMLRHAISVVAVHVASNLPEYRQAKTWR